MPPGCPYRFLPDDWVEHGLPLNKDPREFRFPIICSNFRVNANSLRQMRLHLNVCPNGKRPNLTCGHCRFTTRSWPAMCAHLNQIGTQHADPCEPAINLNVETSPSTSALLLPLELPVVPQDGTGDSLSRDVGPSVSVRRGLQVAGCITSPVLAAPGDIPFAASRSPLPPPLPLVHLRNKTTWNLELAEPCPSGLSRDRPWGGS